MADLIGKEEWSTVQRTQVFTATHDESNSLLSSVQRSYISFSWTDLYDPLTFTRPEKVDIEKFKFIVVNNGDMFDRQFYSGFKDLTTSYDIIDGQHYWGTSFEPNELEFDLATDEVDELTLQEFRHYFQPGIVRELILSEFPYRAILARVSDPPEFSMLPFEKKVTCNIGGIEYTTSTTVWRGSAHIKFVMDDPFWYSVKGIFQDNDDLGEDEIKAIVDDGIPAVKMLETNCFLGNDYIAENYNNSNGSGSTIQINASAEGINMTKNTDYYLYYCGTAMEKPEIHFTFDINQFDSAGYFNGIGNTYVEGVNYGEIQIGNEVFKFTTPSFITAYNQVVSIVRNDFEAGNSITDLTKAIRDSVNNFYVRAWATGICEWSKQHGNDIVEDVTSGALKEGFANNFIEDLQSIFAKQDQQPGYTMPCMCWFNTQTGEATMTVNMETLNLPMPKKESSDADTESESSPENNTESDTSSQTLPDEHSFQTNINKSIPAIQITENSGDMARSKYITIKERKLPTNTDGQMKITSNECLVVRSNCDLHNVRISYRYRYL